MSGDVAEDDRAGVRRQIVQRTDSYQVHHVRHNDIGHPRPGTRGVTSVVNAALALLLIKSTSATLISPAVSVA